MNAPRRAPGCRQPASVPRVVAGRLTRALVWARTPLPELEQAVVTGAACTRRSPEQFFPPFDDRRSHLTESVRAERRHAERACAGCPVVAQCLALSFRLGPRGAHGVWGATSAADRAELRPEWRSRQTGPGSTTSRADVVERGQLPGARHEEVRAAGLVLLSNGIPPDAVADALGVTRRSVDRWRASVRTGAAR